MVIPTDVECKDLESFRLDPNQLCWSGIRESSDQEMVPKGLRFEFLEVEALEVRIG